MSSPTVVRRRPSARRSWSSGEGTTAHRAPDGTGPGRTPGPGAPGGRGTDAISSAIATAEAGRVQALEVEVEQLRAAMANRATIEQAKGILMLLSGCSEAVAFDLLAHISSHTHRKVREVAQSITESASGTAPLPREVGAIIHDACPPGRRPL